MFAKLSKLERGHLLSALSSGYTCGVYNVGNYWYATTFPEEYICAFIIKPKNHEKTNTPI